MKVTETAKIKISNRLGSIAKSAFFQIVESKFKDPWMTSDQKMP
jgi:hypothetical protein